MGKEVKKKVGRPKLELDKDQIRELARIQCTMIEIASVMKCSVDTLENNFSDVIKEGKEEGKTSLRRAQYKRAMSGNPTMLIWLGKHILGQKDEEITSHFKPHVLEVVERWKREAPSQ